MAYNFTAAGESEIGFSVAPIDSYLAGPVTLAWYLRRNAISNQNGLSLANSGKAVRFGMNLRGTGVIRAQIGGTAIDSPATFSSTSVWYLMVVTWAGGSSDVRFHVHDGTSWSHANGGGSGPGNLTVASTDTMRIQALTADVVCAGLKKTNASDAACETLSRTSFQAWADFAFDWLIGFDAIGTRNDQASPGTGDETDRFGVSLSSDPAGWSWTLGPPPSTFVPKIIVIG